MSARKNALHEVLRKAHGSSPNQPAGATEKEAGVRIAGHVPAEVAEWIRNAAVHYGWTVGEVLAAAVEAFRAGKKIPARPQRALKRGRRIGG